MSTQASIVLDLPSFEQIDSIQLVGVDNDWTIEGTAEKPSLKLNKGKTPSTSSVEKKGNTLVVNFPSNTASEAVLHIPHSFKGSLSVKTNSGEIEVLNLTNLKSCTLENISGDTDFNCWPAEQLTVKTVSGDVKGKSDRNTKLTKSIAVETENGDLSFELTAGFSQINIKSQGGDCKLLVPVGHAFNYSVDTTNGTIRFFEDTDGSVKTIQGNGTAGVRKGYLGREPKAELVFKSLSGDLKTANSKLD